MKKFVIFFIIFTQNILFGQVKDSLREVFEKIHLGYKKQCSIDSLKAIEDSKTKTIYYINIPAPNGYDLLQKNELSEILKKYNIEFGGTWMGSDIAGTYSDNQCYNWIMTKNAEKKFGEEFFEEKINEALKIFIKRNPNRVFDYRTEEIDYSAKILGIKEEEQSKTLKIGFWKKYKLPRDYIFKKNEEYYSFVNAYFIIDQKGKVSDLEVEAKIQNPENKKHKDYFEKSFKEYIENVKWKPSIYKGFKVKNNVISIIELP
jgi:hypothetical protein